MPPLNPPEYNPPKTSRLPLIIVSLLLILALVFGFWAYGQMQDYKNNSDAKSAAAVAAAEKTQAAKLQAQFDEQSKSPYKTFTGSATYGTVSFNYPKTWSAYVASDSNEPINAYFNPDQVPGVDSNTPLPLRVELLNTDYAQAVQQFSTQVSDGSVKATAYVPPKMKGVNNVTPGTRFDGQVIQTDNGYSNGSIVIIKVRDKTLQISTQTDDGQADFNNIILASLTFVP
jgi:hypothetical protein